MSRTHAFTLAGVLLLTMALAIVMLVNAAYAAPAAPCDPARHVACCGCDASDSAEPPAAPHLYLPIVAVQAGQQ